MTKQRQKFLVSWKKSIADTYKNVFKRAIPKISDAIVCLIGNKVTEKNTVIALQSVCEGASISPTLRQTDGDT